MRLTLGLVVLLTVILLCNGVSIHEQGHNARRRLSGDSENLRRMFSGAGENILGAPRHSYHLPPAEAILPGHTLLRPALGMLKSAVKFPHRDLENGGGVYGNTNNVLGIRWDGRNERLAYSGFRRMLSNSMELNSEGDINWSLIVPQPRNLQNRLHRSQKTYDFMRQMLDKLKSQRRQADVIILKKIPNRDPEDLLVDDLNINFVEAVESPKNISMKQKWFWGSKNAYNHIKVDTDAPTIEDHLPSNARDNDGERKWWYFHEYDFQPFLEHEM